MQSPKSATSRTTLKTSIKLPRPSLLLAALVAGTILFALDLPYILFECDAGYCNASFDAPMGAFLVIKGVMAATILGWLAVSLTSKRALLPDVYESVLHALLVGTLAVSLEGVISGGLLYVQFLNGAPNSSDIGSIPFDIVLGLVFIEWVASMLGGPPAMLSAYLKHRLLANP